MAYLKTIYLKNGNILGQFMYTYIQELLLYKELFMQMSVEIWVGW